MREAIATASACGTPAAAASSTQRSMCPYRSRSSGSTPSEQSMSRSRRAPEARSSPTMERRSRRIEPSRAMTHMPRRRRSAACPPSMGSWHECMPAAAYALSFAPDAPAVWPLTGQPAPSIAATERIAAALRPVTFVHEKTSPMHATSGREAASASSAGERAGPCPNRGSTGRPPGTAWNMRTGRPPHSLANSAIPPYPATRATSIGSENMLVVPRRTALAANSDGRTNWSRCTCGSARPGQAWRPCASCTRVRGPSERDASGPT